MTRTATPPREQGVDDDFLFLIYADPDWLRAEFDAIIAAAWRPAAPRPVNQGGAAHRPREPARPGTPHPLRSVDNVGTGLRRQRSPPVGS